MTHEAKQKRLGEIVEELNRLDAECSKARVVGPDAMGFAAYYQTAKRINEKMIALSNEAFALSKAEGEPVAGELEWPETAEQARESLFELLTEPREAVRIGLLADEALLCFVEWCKEQCQPPLRDPQRRKNLFSATLVAEGVIVQRFAELVRQRKGVAA